MNKPKLWTILAAGGALAIALSGAALGANVTDLNADSASPAALAHRSDVATAVLGALTGGSNPTTVAANANANENATAAHATNTNANTTTDETTDTDVSASQETSQASSTGTKPGWGCGDTNHDHTVPPGNPNATSPCNKH
jgi:hypothetical protein